MSNTKEIAIRAMQAMLSSKYYSDYVEDGRQGRSCDLSHYDAIAKEAFKYAKALEKEFEADYRR